jgi:predicted TIM-barrel fold metal-dependent hydrolase
MARGRRQSSDIRESLGHPVIDADGHILEMLPAVLPFVREQLGAAQFEHFRTTALPVEDMVRGPDDDEEARATRIPQGAWWATPARNTVDLATAAFPELLYERMGSLGIDYAILYPTKALGAAAINDPELRRGACRGFNEYYAATYNHYGDRFRVAGVVPMHSPEEACDALRHAQRIGLRVVVLPDGVVRPIRRPPERTSRLLPGQTHWLDTFGIDSEYDYDPVWRLCVELGFAVNFHVGVGAVVPRVSASVSNYVCNHLGFFAERMHNLCKSLYMGGVTARFPEARFSFLEAGCMWACGLGADLVEHWERRNLTTLLEDLDPTLIDWAALESLAERYGRRTLAGLTVAEKRKGLRRLPAVGVTPSDLDEWSAVRVSNAVEVMERFADSFFFGCEADDVSISVAYSPVVPAGKSLRPMFSSDMGHWDAGDLSGVLEGAYGLVERGLVTADEFESFVFGNVVRLFADPDPTFFAETAVGAAAGRALAGLLVADSPPTASATSVHRPDK